MSLEQDVQKALTETGEKLKKDLWSPSDHAVLAHKPRDHEDLELKAKLVTDPNKRAQYRLGAKLITDHVQTLALTRMNLAEKHIEEAIGNAFASGLNSALSSLLPNVR